MKYRKWLLPCLGLIVLRSSLSQMAPEVRRGIYRGREVQFPRDARQFKGWRHYGHNAPVWKVSEDLPEDVFTPWYFSNDSEKHAYPLGINIVFYALTH